MRKIFFLGIISILPILVNGQKNKINSRNYYEHYNASAMTTNWLQREEIVPIIMEELEKFSFERNYPYTLYKISSNNWIVLDVFCRKDNFGFIINTGHSSIPELEHRKINTYKTVFYDNNAKLNRLEYDSLPKGIQVLREDCYWYQYKNDKHETNEHVDYQTIKNILKEDIRSVLSLYKNLEKALEENKWKVILPNPRYSGLMFVDSWAKFIDGQSGIDEYIAKSLVFPEKALKKELEGSVTLVYEVTEVGEIGVIQIIEGGNKLFEEEAIRVIKSMPKWKPGIREGKPISIKYVQKFTFKI